MVTFPREIIGSPRCFLYPTDPVTPDIVYRNGNAAMALQGMRLEHILILQVCNDIGAYGAGFSGEIEKMYPGVRDLYKQFIRDRQHAKDFILGRVQYLHVDDEVVVANMVCQKGIRSKISDPVALDYTRLAACLNRVAYDFVKDFLLSPIKWTIQMPRIGCGLAGGHWPKVADIIRTTLCSAGASPIVYDPPKYSRQ